MLAGLAAHWSQLHLPARQGLKAMRRIVLALLVAFLGNVHSASPPYDESADAKLELRLTQAAARQAGVPMLVVFGANWCGDCKMLDQAFKQGASAELIAKHFRVVKVDVGRFDRNVDLAQAYGVPLKSGIPAVAVVSGQGQLIYATRAGELADARALGDTGIHDFFARLVAQHK